MVKLLRKAIEWNALLESGQIVNQAEGTENGGRGRFLGNEERRRERKGGTEEGVRQRQGEIQVIKLSMDRRF